MTSQSAGRSGLGQSEGKVVELGEHGLRLCVDRETNEEGASGVDGSGTAASIGCRWASP